MTNFISNSLKFTKNGYIYITLSDLDDYSLIVQIIDNGSGINKNNLLLIGNDYQTFDNGLGYNKGGIGLGLSICK
jgi:signal transduction histidine kinase